MHWLLMMWMVTTSSFLSGQRLESDPMPEPHPQDHMVLLIAIDGLEWDIVLPLLEQNRLPIMKTLMNEGVYGELATFQPTVSPAIWTTIATGYGPEIHGIPGFKIGLEKDDRLVASFDRRVKALWNISSDFKRRTAMIGYWVTWPVEPIFGTMVAQVNVLKPNATETTLGVGKGSLFEDVENQVYPGHRTKEILNIIPDVVANLPTQMATVFAGPWNDQLGAVENRLWDNTVWSVRADSIYRAVALELLKKDEPYDLFTVYFGGPDVIGHLFWRYARPQIFTNRPSKESVQALGHYITDYYVHMDQVIGELIEASPPKTTVIIVSDHGMRSENKDGRFLVSDPNFKLMSGGHSTAPNAFFLAYGHGIRSTHRTPSSRDQVAELGTVFDIAPTVLALMGLPVGKDIEGKPLKVAFDPKFLASHPVQYVNTHTPKAYRAKRTKNIQKRTPHLEEVREEQLRSLGYIE